MSRSDTDNQKPQPSRSAITGVSRSKWILTSLIIVYLLAIVGLALAERYTIIWKTATVPALLLAALLARQFHRFIRDWAVFLGLVVLFDSIRGMIFSLICLYELPFFMQYAVSLEKALFAGVIPAALLQEHWFQPPEIAFHDRFLTIVHASHFLYFLFFGLVLWFVKHEHFRKFKSAFVTLMYSGLAVYLLVPTIPPWMAADNFHAHAPVERIASLIYNLTIPTLQASFDVNPIAAMPSLHAAFPTLCLLIGIQHFGRKSWFMWPYTALVFLAIIYLGEHYVVDVLAGVVMAAIIFSFTYHSKIPAWLTAKMPSLLKSQMPMFLRIAVVILILGLSEMIGQFTLATRTQLIITPQFVARELSDDAGLGHYFTAFYLFRKQQFGPAQEHMMQAIATGSLTGDKRSKAAELLARSAYVNKDYQTVVDALTPYRDSDLHLDLLISLGRSHHEIGNLDESIDLMRQLTLKYPTQPDPLYWLTKYQFLGGKTDASRVQEVIRRLPNFSFGEDRIVIMQRDLENMIDAANGNG